MDLDDPVPALRARGSIVRVSVSNFMQYNESSFSPGPNLNVILGPNGAGKSSLILAIGLGLAGKPNMLGRAAHLGEYVRVGAERAEIRVELAGGEDRDNVVVERAFGRDGERGRKMANSNSKAVRRDFFQENQLGD